MYIHPHGANSVISLKSYVSVSYSSTETTLPPSILAWIGVWKTTRITSSHSSPVLSFCMALEVYTIKQSINQYIAFILCRRLLGYTLIYIIPIGLGTVANVTVLQFCIYNLLSQVIFPSFPRSSSWSLSWHFLHIHSLC